MQKDRGMDGLIWQEFTNVHERKKMELDSIQPLIAKFVVEYNYNSNAIEENTLTLRETDMVLRGLTIEKKPLKDHIETVGH